MRRTTQPASGLVPLLLAAATVLAVPSPAHADTLPGPGFPPRYTAPFLGTWGSGDALTEAHRATGLDHFTLGFVLSDGGCNGAFDGTIPVTEEGWPDAVSRLRAGGGDVIVSFGGGFGTELAQVCDSVDSLKAAYRRIVDALDLTRIDFDVEGAAVDDAASVDRRDRAVAALQREYAAADRALHVHYTLPVNPDGLSPDAVRLLRNARERGVTVSVVNIMTMDYGPDLDMGATAVEAADGLLGQLAQIWPEKTTAELWGMQGNTPRIGVNDFTNEVFSAEDARTLAAFADAKGIQLLAFWSVDRDRACPTDGELSETCSGVPQQPAAFSHLLGRARPRPVPDRWPTACSGLGPSFPACTGPLTPPPGAPLPLPLPLFATPGRPARTPADGWCGDGRTRSVWARRVPSCPPPPGP
ncbi:chitinase [Kitasatospora sp. NPDC089797]|uniref:chitinase n=1 Tax=Kitasatospora sp. NPDC089797 TaxID=3155298 RepID=UPI00343056BF